MGLGEGLGCSGTCAKYILFIVNFFVFLCGAAILGVGLALLLTEDAWNWFADILYSEDGMSDPLLQASVYTMIAVGALLFVVGFFGCCGACKESKCMLMAYVVFIIFILLIQLAGAVLAIVFRSDLEEAVETAMYSSVQTSYGAEGNDATTRSWDEMQIDWDCCGSDSHTDYINSTWYVNTGSNTSVPESCCIGATIDEDNVILNEAAYTQCLFDATNSYSFNDTYHAQGCHTKMHDWLEEYTLIVIAVLVGIGVLEIIAVCFAFCVRDQLDD